MSGFTISYCFGQHDVSNLEHAIADKECRVKDLAGYYAYAIIAEHKKLAVVDWRKTNEAIIARWSESALNQIKKAAWKMRVPAGPVPIGQAP
jgi:hypothetical protein